MKSLLGFMGAVVLLLAFAFPSQAQTKYDLSKSTFTHNWTQAANSGPVVEWHYLCGAKAGGYTLDTKVIYQAPPVGSTQYVTPASIVLSNVPGVYFCVVNGKNAYGSSGNSNEVNGDWGFPPNGVGTSLSVAP